MSALIMSTISNPFYAEECDLTIQVMENNITTLVLVYHRRNVYAIERKTLMNAILIEADTITLKCTNQRDLTMVINPKVLIRALE